MKSVNNREKRQTKNTGIKVNSKCKIDACVAHEIICKLVK